MSKSPIATIIIPTTCSRERHASLLRAVTSLLHQQDVAIEVLLIINGNRCDDEALAACQQLPGVRIHRQAFGSLPAAMTTGRVLVTTPFFGFLDDDDEYHSHAVARRLAPMLADKSIDLVVSNGLHTVNNNVVPLYEDISGLEHDPLRALLQKNWLKSCAALFRTDSITLNYFDPQVKYTEWTLMAFKLCLAHKKIKFINDLTYRIHFTPESLSASSGAIQEGPWFRLRLLSQPLPRDVRKFLRNDYCMAQHTLSDYLRTQGNLGPAFIAHVKSCGTIAGLLNHVLFTRYFLRDLFRRNRVEPAT